MTKIMDKNLIAAIKPLQNEPFVKSGNWQVWTMKLGFKKYEGILTLTGLTIQETYQAKTFSNVRRICFVPFNGEGIIFPNEKDSEIATMCLDYLQKSLK